MEKSLIIPYKDEEFLIECYSMYTSYAGNHKEITMYHTECYKPKNFISGYCNNGGFCVSCGYRFSDKALNMHNFFLEMVKN